MSLALSSVMSLLRKRYDRIALFLSTVPHGTSTSRKAHHNSHLALGEMERRKGDPNCERIALASRPLPYSFIQSF